MMWLVFGLATALCYAAGPLLTRYVLREERMKAIALEPLVSIIATSFMLLITVSLVGFQAMQLDSFAYAMTTGVLFYAAALLWQIVTQTKESSYVTPILQTESLLALIIGVTFLSEQVTETNIAGILLLFIGGYIIAFNGIKLPKASPEIIILLGSCLLATIGKSFGSIGAPTNPLMFALAVYFSRSLVGVLVVALFKRNDFELLLRKITARKRFGLAVLTRSLFQTLATAFIFFGVSLGLVSKFVPITNLAPLISVIIGGKLLKEKHLALRMVASLLMVAGAFLVVA
ncbi:MAG: EamA family transporter [Candidatus Diapherotrites archaeon]|nr:EamA family transporter [Candidatus Diapherotrites archaeon]